MSYNLYVDGGGTPTVPTYFSFKCIECPWLSVERMFSTDVPKELIPKGCSITRPDGTGTNNLAEFQAVFFALKAFRMAIGTVPVIVYHDSENVVFQVLGTRQVRSVHLMPWYDAVKKIWWKGINYQWINRNEIVKVLGH